jgi:hypothetical protein
VRHSPPYHYVSSLSLSLCTCPLNATQVLLCLRCRVTHASHLRNDGEVEAEVQGRFRSVPNTFHLLHKSISRNGILHICSVSSAAALTDLRAETYNWLKTHTQECPKCKTSIEKNGGCNHMCVPPPPFFFFDFRHFSHTRVGIARSAIMISAGSVEPPGAVHLSLSLSPSVVLCLTQSLHRPHRLQQVLSQGRSRKERGPRSRTLPPLLPPVCGNDPGRFSCCNSPTLSRYNIHDQSKKLEADLRSKAVEKMIEIQSSHPGFVVDVSYIGTFASVYD